ncbi:gamma-glutamyltransferase [bacterium]|nr:gamma-glutamyltransferase [bacterium]
MITQKIEETFTSTKDSICAIAHGGMVSTAFPDATRAGVRLLENGGNAIDAAAAAALALCVCEPQASGIGGQSSALIHFGGKSLFLDGSGTIPKLYRNNQVTAADMQVGYKGTTVPTTLSLLHSMHASYGTLPWADIVTPAYDLAKNGYNITQLQQDLLERERELFTSIPNRSAQKYFYKNGENPYEAGDLFVQSELADVLDQVRRYGIKGFYQGDVALAIDKDMRTNGGFLRKEDLAQEPVPIERNALKSIVFGKEIVTTTPPSQGRLLLMALHLAEHLQKQEGRLQSPERLALLADFLYEVYRDRMENPIFPDQYTLENDHALSDPRFMQYLYESILTRSEQPRVLDQLQGGETTHLSVMDDKGNAVGVTQSVNMVYGSKTAAEGLGFIYNNYMIDSYQLPEDHPNAPVPGGCAPTSIAPFIIFENNKPWLIAGSPGSQRIVTALTQFLVHVLGAGMSIDRAVAMPRIHCEQYKQIMLEEGGFERSTLSALEQLGYTVKEKPTFYVGAIHAILRCQHSDCFQGVADLRRDGIAAGPKP